MTVIYWPDFATNSHSPEGSSWQHIGLIFWLSPTPPPFESLNERNPLELSGSHWYERTRMAGLQSGKGCMTDSVVWAQYINVTDTQTATSPEQIPPCALASGVNNCGNGTHKTLHGNDAQQHKLTRLHHSTSWLDRAVVLNLESRDPLGVPNTNLGGPKRKSQYQQISPI